MERSSRKNHSVDNESPPKKISRVSSVDSDARAQGAMMAENVKLEYRPGCEETCKFTGVALSNFLILKRIFNCLNDEDLNTCLEVSSLWKSVAQPLVIPHYDIQVTDDSEVIVTRRTYGRNDGSDTTECLDRFRDWDYDVIEQLTEITQAGKIAISLAVKQNEEDTVGELCEVLPTFGRFVFNLGFHDMQKKAGAFCKDLVKYFPNLRSLRFSDGFLEEGGYDQDFDPLLPQNQLLHLRKIDLTDLRCGTSCLVKVLRTAPNLEEIHNLPLILVQSLVETQKACLLKSFSYRSRYYGENDPCRIHGETLDSALEKLAQLGPKLNFFSFKLDKKKMSLEDSKPRMLQILRSSYDTLRNLTVKPSVLVGFQGIPPFTSLKKIKFILKSDCKETPPRIFPEEVVLLHQFPNVTEIDIHLPQNKYMKDYFPQNVFSPWGSQIQKLKICLADVDTIGLMGQIFPSVNCFGFEMVELPDNLNSTLEAISQVWPEVESVHIKIDKVYEEYWGTQPSLFSSGGASSRSCIRGRVRFGASGPCHRYQRRTQSGTMLFTYKPLRDLSLDSALTGIPDDTLVRLKKDSSLPTILSTEQIRKLQEESTIRKLKKLKMLKFDFNDEDEATKGLSTLTLLSHEFGFHFLPELKVVVRIPHEMEILEGVEQTFQHLNLLKFERKDLIPSSSP